MNLFFWTLLNLGVPIIGPIFTLALVAPARGWRAAGTLIAASVKDGQLFWCATGLCASAIYEGLTELEGGSDNVSMLEISMMACCLLGFSCSVIVMACLLDAHDEQARARARAQRTVFVAGGFPRAAIGTSIFLVAVAAILFAIIHTYPL